MLSLDGGRRDLLRRRDNRIIIHFDYDAFYASVIEAENPELRSLPLAIQQKQIIATCNYEARRRGLRKLQLVTEAKRICPEVVIVLGEDLTRFRDASKTLYNILRGYSWNDKVEKLGFDEVWMDVGDIIDYNVELLNRNDLRNSFFHLSKLDPTLGFLFDASRLAGSCYPPESTTTQRLGSETLLFLRLLIASHLALHLRHQLEEQKGYTSTVGISTSKLLSKLAGSLNKPKGQTILLPPYEADSTPASSSNVNDLLDDLEIGSIPYIGFKTACKLRELALGRPAEIETGLVYGPPKEKITVGIIRRIQGLTPERLEDLLTAPGTPHGIGARIFASIHGIDDTEVAPSRNVPRQISIEDSYMRLDTIEQVFRELHILTKRLLERMRMDLTGDNDDQAGENATTLKWMAYPSTLRLSTRPRPPLNADGTRNRSFNRISRSTSLPRHVFSLIGDTEDLSQRLVSETLIPLFKKLHPETDGWNLSLINVAVTGMDEKQEGTDIDAMFRNQQKMEKEEDDMEAAFDGIERNDYEQEWDEESEEDSSNTTFMCSSCGHAIPTFAVEAHERFHALGT